jgi:hypothetical protein
LGDAAAAWRQDNHQLNASAAAELTLQVTTRRASLIPAFTSTTGFILTNGTLQGLARSNNQVLRSFAGDGQLSSAPIVVNNSVFIGSAGGNLYVWIPPLGRTRGARTSEQPFQLARNTES